MNIFDTKDFQVTVTFQDAREFNEDITDFIHEFDLNICRSEIKDFIKQQFSVQLAQSQQEKPHIFETDTSYNVFNFETRNFEVQKFKKGCLLKYTTLTFLPSNLSDDFASDFTLVFETNFDAKTEELTEVTPNNFRKREVWRCVEGASTYVVLQFMFK